LYSYIKKVKKHMTNQKTILAHAKLYCTSDGHEKEWSIWQFEDGIRTAWGKINSTLQEKWFPGEGEVFYNKKIKEKLGKDYYFVD
jgi:hypothetical protein